MENKYFELIKEIYYDDVHHISFRIGSWNGCSPVIEKRKIYKDNLSDKQYGRAMGLNLSDLALIHSKWNEIIKLLRSSIPCQRVGRKKNV